MMSAPASALVSEWPTGGPPVNTPTSSLTTSPRNMPVLSPTSSSSLLSPRALSKKRGKMQPGTPHVIRRRKICRSFQAARAYAMEHGIKSQRHWHRWSKAGRRPVDIPGNPDDYYANEWRGWGHFLGTRNISKALMKFKSYVEARRYVSTLGLRTQREWQAWSKSGRRPSDIPSNPQTKYQGKGWRGWPRFLSPVMTAAESAMKEVNKPSSVIHPKTTPMSFSLPHLQPTSPDVASPLAFTRYSQDTAGGGMFRCNENQRTSSAAQVISTIQQGSQPLLTCSTATAPHLSPPSSSSSSSIQQHQGGMFVLI